jgi:monothiol bacilliredoxin
MEIRKLKDKKEWKELTKNSPNKHELIIYKFSPICPISHSADLVINDWYNLHKEKENVDILKVNIIFSKSLSRKIAKDLSIVHESPQIIWLDSEMKVKYHGSHDYITAEELNKHL